MVAEGSDGDQVEALVERHQPDVLLLDLTMRRCSGLEALTMVRSRWPWLPVILLSMHASATMCSRPCSWALAVIYSRMLQ